MQGVVTIEPRDWELEHQLVEVARAPLPAGLEPLHPSPRGLAVQDGHEIQRLVFRERSPVQVVLHDGGPIPQHGCGRKRP